MSEAKPDTINLREITAATLRDMTGLRVAPEQADSVASNAESIAEAHFHPEAWFRGIYAGDTPVGFVMLEDRSLLPEPDYETPINLWRLMIDRRYQGRGYGRAALTLILEHVRARLRQRQFPTSYVPGSHGPEGFYLGLGFVPTGEVSCSFLMTAVRPHS